MSIGLNEYISISRDFLPCHYAYRYNTTTRAAVAPAFYMAYLGGAFKSLIQNMNTPEARGISICPSDKTFESFQHGGWHLREGTVWFRTTYIDNGYVFRKSGGTGYATLYHFKISMFPTPSQSFVLADSGATNANTTDNIYQQNFGWEVHDGSFNMSFLDGHVQNIVCGIWPEKGKSMVYPTRFFFATVDTRFPWCKANGNPIPGETR